MVDVKPVIAQLVGHLIIELCRDQVVPGLIPGGRIRLTPYVDQKLADVLQCNQH